MSEFSEEMMEEYRRDCDKAKSNLEAPLLGRVLTPICISCVHSDFHTDPWKPKCAKYGEMPLKYRRADDYDCSNYEQIPNVEDCDLPEHMRKNK